MAVCRLRPRPARTMTAWGSPWRLLAAEAEARTDHDSVGSPRPLWRPLARALARRPALTYQHRVTGPLILRRATVEDAATIASIYAPYVERTAASFELEPPSPQEMAHRIRTIGDRLPWLVTEVDGRVDAYTYASPHRSWPAYQWSVETTIYVAPTAQGQGRGKVLYGALLAGLSLLGYHRAYAGVTLPNPGSVGLHEAVGFTPVGVYRRVGYKLGAWHDVGWWERSLQEGPPVAPTTMEAMAQTRQWREILRTAGAQTDI